MSKPNRHAVVITPELVRNRMQKNTNLCVELSKNQQKGVES